MPPQQGEGLADLIDDGLRFGTHVVAPMGHGECKKPPPLKEADGLRVKSGQ